MGRRSRRVDLDFDRGSSATQAKRAQMVPVENQLERQQERAGLISLGQMAASMPGVHHRTAEANQIIPVSRSQELGHPMKARPAPEQGHSAMPLSSRQKDARSKTRHEAWAKTPQTERRAVHAMVTSPVQWTAVNDALSSTVGDTDALPPPMAKVVRRTDSFVGRYERRNDREHLLHCNLELPASVNHSNIEGFLRKQVQPGDVHAFDRFTACTHQAHETFDAHSDPGGRRVMLRMRTRRGAYLGQSGRKDNTSHLLPRGVHMVVTDVSQQTFTRPDGTTESVWVIDMSDQTPQED